MPELADNRSECPPSQVWDEIATGLLSGDAAECMLEHAAECSNCAQLLREALVVFAPENVAEVKPERKPSWIPGWVAAAALLAFVAAPTLWWWQSQPNVDRATRQLADAYSGSRLMEVRWPGARYGRYALTRSSGSGIPNQDFLAAQETIQKGVLRQPGDSAWQLALAQLRILNGELAGAIADLERLRQTATDRKAVDESLAIAFYQRGESDGERSDYEAADRIWTDLLSRDPKNPTALFNAALAKERLNEPEQAMQLLDHLIAVETDAGWKQEATERRDELRTHLRAQPSR